MKVGDYVRTKDGALGKIIDRYKVYDYYKIKVDIRNGFIEKHREDLFKKHLKKPSSPNIIDLVEVGDYVNGKEIEQIIDNELYFDTNDMAMKISFKNEDIKSIVTKEQFETMQYKVGD